MTTWPTRSDDVATLARIYADFFKVQARRISREVSKRFKSEVVEKRDVEIHLDWDFLVKPTQKHLALVGRRAAEETLGHLRVTDRDIVEQADARAIAYAEERGAELVGKKWVDGKLVENPSAEWVITDTTRENINGLIDQATADGWSSDRLASAIEDSTDFSSDRAEMVARTELAYAHSNGNLEGWQASGVVGGKVWLVGEDPCEICIANQEAGEIGLDDEFPSGDDAPPSHPNCLLPDAVVSAGGISASYKRWFEGEIVVLYFAGNNELSITPNHPVLTRKGWVPAGKLQKGDELFFCISPGEAMASIYPDDHQMPARIQEIPGTLLMAGGVFSAGVPTSSEDFHGDGVSNGEVEIVRANGFLSDDGKIEGFKMIHHKIFSRGYMGRVVLDAESAAAFLLESHHPAASSSVSSFSPSGPDGGTSPESFGSAGGGHGSDGEFKTGKAVSESEAVATEAAGNIAGRLASHISLVKLIDVSIRKYSGHVYNLQTKDGYYIAQNLVVHNCECDVAGVLTEASEAYANLPDDDAPESGALAQEN